MVLFGQYTVKRAISEVNNMIKENRVNIYLFINCTRMKINPWSLKEVNLGEIVCTSFIYLANFEKCYSYKGVQILKINSFQRVYTHLWKRNS